MQTESTEHDSSGKAEYKGKLTLNNRGSMLEYLDEYTELGLNLLENRSNPAALDIGCAYGYLSKQILSIEKNWSIKVIANDICKEHLDVLTNDLANEPDKLGRLELNTESVESLELAVESLDAIFALRVLHFLRGTELRRVFRKLFGWLKPGGCLVVSCAAPFLWSLGPDYPPTFKRLLDEGSDWPGEISAEDIKKYVTKQIVLDQVADGFHVFTTEILIREAKLAGFDVLKSGYTNMIRDHSHPPESKLKNDFACLVAIKGIFE